MIFFSPAKAFVATLNCIILIFILPSLVISICIVIGRSYAREVKVDLRRF